MANKLCLEMGVECIHVQQCFYCYNNNACLSNKRLCENHKNCFQCRLKDLKHGEILPCDTNSLPDIDVVNITDLTDQVQKLKNALELAEREKNICIGTIRELLMDMNVSTTKNEKIRLGILNALWELEGLE